MPPAEAGFRQRIERKSFTQLSFISAQIDTCFDHEMYCQHERDKTQHFTRPDADSREKSQRLLCDTCNYAKVRQIIALCRAAEVVLRDVSALVLREHCD